MIHLHYVLAAPGIACDFTSSETFANCMRPTIHCNTIIIIIVVVIDILLLIIIQVILDYTVS